jgi:uncharacterized protein YbaR (Trm112 family)
MTDTSAPGTEADHGGLDPRLLDLLRCPETGGPLHYDREANELISRAAGLAYPVRDGVPVMLPEEARQL